ncbi:MAG: hypothetical protein JXO22_07655, partial [Phycisphaerae bacterium]|nr:hypothetical protein [Phycisphaerae bacterium]
MESRRLITAIMAALAVFFAYNLIWSHLRPKKPVQPVTTQPVPGETRQIGTAEQATPTSPITTAATTTRESLPALHFSQGTNDEPVILGGGVTDKLKLELSPRGAAVASLWLSERKPPEPDGRYLYRQQPRENEPYTLLSPVVEPGQAPGSTITHYSYVTQRIIIKERGDESYRLSDLVWEVVPRSNSDDGRRV